MVRSADAATVGAVLVIRGDFEAAQRIIEEVANLTDLDEQFRQPSLPLMRGWLAATQGDLDRAMANLRPLDAAAESRDVLALVARLDCGPLRDRDCGA